MSDSVQELVTKWNIVASSFTLGIGITQKILGADPRRWCVLFWSSTSSAVIVSPFSPPSIGDRSWNLSGVQSAPLRLDQRDFGPLVPGEWFGSGGATGGTIKVVELIWEN